MWRRYGAPKSASAAGKRRTFHRTRPPGRRTGRCSTRTCRSGISSSRASATDGTEHFLSVSGDPLFDASGAFEGYRGVGTDITERKRAEERLRAAEEQFRGLVEQSIAGIYIIQDGKFAYVNPRFAEILGYDSADELIGRDGLDGGCREGPRHGRGESYAG